MFKALMAVQWKWTRGVILLATVLGFAIPLASVQGMQVDGMSAAGIVARMQSFGVAYAMLAAGVGLAVAVLAWSPDHRGRHVYALSLPVDRSWYAAMRFGAGASFLVIPTLGVLAGAALAVMVAPMPQGLHAYPVSLALRFLLASGVAYSIFFAVASSTPKAAGVTLGLIASLFVVAFAFSASAVEFDVLGHVSDLLFTGFGLLTVFTGRWMLIDA